MEYLKTIKAAFPYEPYKLQLCDLNRSINDGESVSNFVRSNILRNIELIDFAEFTAKRRKYRPIMLQFDNTRFPFYTWKHKDFKYEIKDLLSGNDVFLHANISTANIPHPRAYNAIKFNIVWLNLRTANETRQSELLKAFAEYMVHMEMMGDQYYQCAGKIFFNPNKLASLPMSYNIGGVSDSMQHLREIPAQYSPYTTWGFRLEPWPPWTDRDGHLHEFADDEIDLESIGVCSAIPNLGGESSLCDYNELKKNYQLAETFDEAQ